MKSLASAQRSVPLQFVVAKSVALAVAAAFGTGAQTLCQSLQGKARHHETLGRDRARCLQHLKKHGERVSGQNTLTCTEEYLKYSQIQFQLKLT